MNCILNANWLRLRKRPATWIFPVICLLLTLNVCLSNAHTGALGVPDFYRETFSEFIFMIGIGAELMLAVWCLIAFRKEDLQGQLTAGHSRTTIYLANLLTAMRMAVMTILPCVLVLAMTCVQYGAELPDTMVWQWVLLVWSVLGWAAVSVMIAMVVPRVLCILPLGIPIVLTMVLMGNPFAGTTPPETILIVLLPQTQLGALATGIPMPWIALGAALNFAVSTGIGLFCFARKDLE